MDTGSVGWFLVMIPTVSEDELADLYRIDIGLVLDWLRIDIRLGWICYGLALD